MSLNPGPIELAACSTSVLSRTLTKDNFTSKHYIANSIMMYESYIPRSTENNLQLLTERLYNNSN